MNRKRTNGIYIVSIVIPQYILSLKVSKLIQEFYFPALKTEKNLIPDIEGSAVPHRNINILNIYFMYVFYIYTSM